MPSTSSSRVERTPWKVAERTVADGAAVGSRTTPPGCTSTPTGPSCAPGTGRRPHAVSAQPPLAVASMTLVRPRSTATRRLAGAVHTWAGGPSWSTAPSSTTTIRSASANASPWSWVTATTVRASSVKRPRSSSTSRSRRVRSSAPSGSSSIRTDGAGASARASATRCCSPPDSSWMRPTLRAGRGRPGRAARRRGAPTSAPGRRCMRSPNATLPPTSRCGNSAWSWNMRPTPRRCGGDSGQVPPVDADRPPRRAVEPGDQRRSVHLPEPLGPSTATTSPAATARSTCGSATRSPKRTVRPRRRARGSPPASRAAPVGAEAIDDEHGERGAHHEHGARAKAWPKLSAPGWPSSRSMATGSVGASARAITVVAPNSPSEIANANPADTRTARSTRGRSTSRQTGPATRRGPRRRRAVAGRWSAAPGSSCAPRTAGPPRPGRAARGSGLARRSMGRSRAMRKPKPTVTAEVPSGRSRPTSRARPTRPVARTSAAAASPPSTTDTTVATTAKRNEFASAASGDTNRPCWRGGRPAPATKARPWPWPGAKERSTSTTSGVRSRRAIAARLPMTQARCRAPTARRAPRGASRRPARVHRRASRPWTTSSVPTATSCTSARIEATGRFSSWPSAGRSRPRAWRGTPPRGCGPPRTR